MDTTSHTERRRQFWLEHFNACAADGGTIKAYAQSHGLSVASFYTARKRYACTVVRKAPPSATTGVADAGQRAARFVRVQPAAMPGGARVACRARLSNGAMVELDFDVSALESALRAFAAVS